MSEKETSVAVEKPVEKLDLNDVIGEFGKWHYWLLVPTLILQLFGPGHVLGTVFLAPNIDYWCAKPTSVNVSEEQWKMLMLNSKMNLDGLIEQGNRSNIPDHGRCWRHEVSAINGSNLKLIVERTLKCDQWEYDHSVFKSTVTEQWNLVCSKSWLVSLSQTIFMAGFMAGCLVLGPLTDWIGRKPVIIMSMTVFQVSSFSTIFSYNYTMFLLSRFFIAFGRTGATNAIFILVMETVSTRSRSFVATICGFGWIAGYVMLPGLAYWLRRWQDLQLALTLHIIVLVVVVWFLPESPRWLLTTGKVEAALKIITRASQMNGMKAINVKDATEKLHSQIEKSSSKKGSRKTTVVSLLASPSSRKQTLVLFWIWCMVAFVYYGLSLNAAGGLGGNIYITLAIFGAVQFPTRLGVHFAITRLGRRISLSACLFGVGLSCIFILAVSPKVVAVSWPRIALATTGMSLVAASFAIIYVYSAEIFPTDSRSVGVSSCSLCARIGSMVAPFMKELGEGNDFMIPMGLFGTLAIISGLMALTLPETKDRPLPETICDENKKQKIITEFKTANEVWTTKI